MSSWEKYARYDDWTASAYADPCAYLERRADLIVDLGPRLEVGDRVLDLACGDAALADFLPDQDYVGVDASQAMIAAARRRGRSVVQADMNVFEPSDAVDATLIFRAIYYARNRRAFFERVATYTQKKLVFDLNPRQYRTAEVLADVAAAGFDKVVTRPFFASQSVAVPRVAQRVLRGFETVPLVAAGVLRLRFTIIVAAFRT